MIATELTAGQDPLLARLARLPALQPLVATGPPDDPATEMLARLAGADVYLTRPVSPEVLASALQLPEAGAGLAGAAHRVCP